MNKKSKVEKIKDIPLGGDYALDANDKPIVVYENRSGRKDPQKPKK